MESKLKALKVVDLKEILSKAQVAVTGKTNKPDLIAKILASPEALKVYEEQYGSPAAKDASEAAAPASTKPASSAAKSSTKSAEFQEESATETATSEATKPAASTSTSVSKFPAKPASSAAPTTDVATTATPEDPELEKRKARAARFGIPLVEPIQPKAGKGSGTQQKKGAQSTKNASADDLAKLEARAQRFGIQTQTTAAATAEEPAKNANGRSKGNKRSAPEENVDSEEQERRRKRAERFGFPVTSVNA